MSDQQNYIQQPLNQPPLLPSIDNLLKRTWQIYKERIKVFLGIAIIPILVSVPLIIILVAGTLLLSKNIWFFASFLAIYIPVIVIFQLWAMLALLFAIKERSARIGIIDSFRIGWHKILPYLWISIISSFLIIGGFLLFIIPGIIFSIWFSFAVYILICEDLRGMKALFRSKQLIKGYWWNVFGRFIVIQMIAVVISLLPLIGVIISFLFLPFSVTFSYLIYEDLKNLKKNVPFETPKRSIKIKFIIIGIAGLVILGLGIWFSIPAWKSSLPRVSDDLLVKQKTPTTEEFDLEDYIEQVLIKDNPDILDSEKYLGPEYYKIFEELKSPSGNKTAVLFGLDIGKTKECCLNPIGLFVIVDSKLHNNYKILKGALQHLYIDNVIWEDENKISYDIIVLDEGDEKIDKSYLILTEDETTNWKTYRNEEYRFEVKYPEDWEYTDYRVFQEQLNKKEGSVNFFDPNDRYEKIESGLSEKWKLVINNPIPETGLEDMQLLEEKEIKILESNKYLRLQIYEPIEPTGKGEEYIIKALYNTDDWENSGQLSIFSTTGELSHNKQLLEQILSTFKFIE